MSQPTIAIIGASADRNKYGNKAVRAYMSRGYAVFPIHPRETTIEGLSVYPSVADVPHANLDRISIYLPKESALRVLDEIAAKPAKEVWFNPGTDDTEVIAAARKRGLPLVIGCSIVDIGVNPHAL